MTVYMTPQAAEILGLTTRAVVAHIKRGNIKAEKQGRFYLISSEEIERFQRERRGVGYPKGRRRKE